MSREPLPIPAVAHIVWLSGRLSDVGWLAVRMALDRGGFERVQLWSHRGALDHDRRIAVLHADPRVELCAVEDLALSGLDAATHPGVLQRLIALTGQLQQPAARADVWRLLVLWAQGGVYLDADALCLRDLAPLRSHPAFCGLEHIALPAKLYRSRNPLRWARAGLLLGVRHALAQRKGAGQRFTAVARHFDLACNNAVLGAAPHAPFVAGLLQRIAAMPPQQALRLYELGPRLLEAATQNQTTPAVAVLPPTAFYPLPPEICADYVHPDPQGQLGDCPHPEAYVAHLYDSVLARRVGRRIDVAWLQAHQGDTLLGRMVAPWVAELVAASRG